MVIRWKSNELRNRNKLGANNLSGWWKEEHFDGLVQTAKYNIFVGCQVEEENKPWSEATSH
jgi:hypothetical protein